jgi:sugar-specific transcriptional regulator TrmB
LASTIPGAKKTLYIAEAPQKIMSEIKKKEELLTRFMPNLEALYNARKEKPQVQLFEGIEGVKNVYKKVFQSESVWFFGTAQEVLKIEPSAWIEFLKQAQEKKLQVRDLVMQSSEDKKYVAEIQANTVNKEFYHIRHLPSNVNLPADSAIFGDSFVMFSFRPQIFSVLITSKDISALMRVLYEMAWNNAEPI